MKRVIGIVSEGPTDQMAIRTVIDRLTGEKNIYRYIQPEQDAIRKRVERRLPLVRK